MKKSKEILIWGSTLLCIYFVAWLIFTLDIFSKGKDIENNLKDMKKEAKENKKSC
mgnify:CR=1 FL=1